MIINYDENKLKNALQDFYNVTGLGILIVDSHLMSFGFKYMKNKYCHFIQQTIYGKRRCVYSDRCLLEKCRASKKTEMHICHAGLVDVAVPIMYEDDVVAYIMIGQMKTKESFDDAKEGIVELCQDSLNIAKEHYDQLPLYDEEKIKSTVSLATMLAQHILFGNIIKPEKNRNIDAAIDFIINNIDKNLTVDYITQNINVSKNVLYKHFHEFLGCTVNEYITQKRIEKSVELLKFTDLTIEEISQRVGFSSVAYYSASFKKKTGISPLKYRKQKN